MPAREVKSNWPCTTSGNEEADEADDDGRHQQHAGIGHKLDRQGPRLDLDAQARRAQMHLGEHPAGLAGAIVEKAAETEDDQQQRHQRHRPPPGEADAYSSADKDRERRIGAVERAGNGAPAAREAELAVAVPGIAVAVAPEVGGHERVGEAEGGDDQQRP